MFIHVLIIILPFCSCLRASCPLEKEEKWSYEHNLKNGPKYWGDKYPKCNGQYQSPIDIKTSDVKKDKDLQKLQLTNYDEILTKFKIENNGHTVQVTPLDDVKRTVLVNGVEYSLNQFHFHWGDSSMKGAEHVINGKQYVMELHFVHLSGDGKIAVVGVLYQFSSTYSHDGLTPIVDSLKQILYKGDSVEVSSRIDLNKLVENKCSFYRYDGSLTTPGCDEGVTWSLCKKTMQIGSSQIDEFRKLYAVHKVEGQDISGCRISNNYRPFQSLNERTVISSQ